MSRSITFDSAKAFMIFLINHDHIVDVEVSCSEDILNIIQLYQKEDWSFLELAGEDIFNINVVNFYGIEFGYYNQENNNRFRVGLDRSEIYGSLVVDTNEFEVKNAQKLEQIREILDKK